MIDVYTVHTPNGVKLPIALEELGVPYRVHRIDLGANEQKRPESLRLNPNGRIPAIVDPDGPGGARLSLAIERHQTEARRLTPVLESRLQSSAGCARPSTRTCGSRTTLRCRAGSAARRRGRP